MGKMSAKKAAAEAVRMLTAPGAELDPYSEGVKMPEMVAQMTKESIEDYARKNPHLRDPSELAEEFMRHLRARV